MFSSTEYFKRKISVVIAVSAILSMNVVHASSTIDFEDLDPGESIIFLSDSYKGFSWSGDSGTLSWVVAASGSTAVSFDGISAHSGQNFVFSNGLINGGVSDLSLSKEGIFDFSSFWARSAFSGFDFTATAHGFLGPTEIYTQDFTVSGVYQLMTFNFSGVDRITVTNQKTNLLIDDIILSPVPEPETYVMLLAGLGLIGFMARRRRKDLAV